MVKVTVKIDGMACGMCESHINDAIRNAFSVRKVSSSHTKGITEIISENALDEQKLSDTIHATGYQVKGITTEPYVKKGLFGFRK